MPLTAITYLGSALAYLLLATLVLVRWRHRPSSSWMLTASLLTVAWALYLAFLSWQFDSNAAMTGGLFEVGRNAGWFALILSILATANGGDEAKDRSGSSTSPQALRVWIAATTGFLLLTLLVFVLPASVQGVQLWRSLTILSMAVAGLVLVEQLYRNTPPQRRWQIKFLCLGLGGIFAFDLFLYADLVLFQTLDSPTWQARGVVSAMVTPLLGLAFSRRLPRKPGEAFVSRSLLFHTTALMGSGLYLLAIGIAAYFLRQIEGDLGTLLQIGFLFGAILLLSLVLFSGSVRARLRLFLSKHFFRYKYDYRQEWLRLTGMLSAEDQPMPFHERCIGAISDLIESSGGLLWVRHDDGRYQIQGALNLGTPTYPPESPTGPLIRFLDRTHWIIELEEYRREPGFYSNLILPDWLLQDPRHWAVVPLLKGDDLVGFVVLAQPRAPHRIDWEERDLLKTAARQLAVYIALVRTQDALLEARQFEAFHRLAAYLVHDLKNISAQLSLICSNAERHRDNPAFISDAFKTVANARDRLERTQAHLRTVQTQGENALPQPTVLSSLLSEVIAESQDERPVPSLEVRQPIEITVDDESLKNSVQHLVRNAQQATADSGWVRLILDADDDWVQIIVADNGSGMDEDFLRRRLFRPFQTTKGNAGMGIGLYEARDRIIRMGGQIDVDSQAGIGTQFTLRLPRRPLPQQASNHGHHREKTAETPHR
ncbi:MAG: XrtA/PEP-CTERM system histidine kinase PrsK [Lamprobacter sp.]|uniref:XrtA/PEP-CTERM system histidine kinase PrsK n=1 Tax=Lamprobacter sp. TaxID=3100796 RepID=UPI002B25E322|nr:XrtA/PEP-CTERM system histidine kinase PrsK [Lamprobacter sp.]MEA3639842.1 XrtA/PEP-CTERM system histidine kinase PrsK [Lamprobacter sp.]